MQNNTQKQNTPRLFVCKLATKVGNVSHQERQAEIAKCRSIQTKLEKYTSWKLLRYAIEQTFGVPFETFDIHQNSNGKWVCDGFFFSISHSHGLCAVVVDTKPIGIDLQKYESRKFHKKLLVRIASDKEVRTLAGGNLLIKENGNFVPILDNKQILSLWCKKEALFKKLDLPAFVTRNIDTTIAKFVETSFTFDNAHYHVAIATSHTDIKTEWVEIE